MEGKQLARKVNPHNPKEEIRTLPQLEAANMRGRLAELCTKNLLQNELKVRNLPGTITESSEFIDSVEGITQIDLILTVNGNKYQIEIRSSCVRNGVYFGITSGFINLLGWYKTDSKQKEPKKDFYLMYLYGFNESETTNKFSNQVDVSFVGGASKLMLQGPLASDKQLKQSVKTLYRCISPICTVYDVDQILNEMFQ
ncbi:hypothetical protein [Candidatus Nitrosotenuis uzonensis]|uniref:hypothetical protein n=1 Tax=Candidatus Nitrosotenuis uzonensis TaxID=1407055 RepID=UPI001B7D7999|nr:hypothetical protein [Candidatus Nitrosotenuis uzonensis]